MPKSTLTEITLRNLKPPASGQSTVWDALPGFGVRVSQGGTKSFIVLLGSGQRHTIGRYPILSLSDARAEAKRLLAERTLGRARPASITFAEALPLFLSAQYHGKKERSRKETERLLNRHFLAKLRQERLANVTTQKVAQILDRLQDTPSEQRHALMAIGTFLRWSVVRRFIPHNPCEGMKFAPSKPRTRVLTENELAAVWHAAKATIRYHHIVRLCILLGQRRGEIGLLRAEYVDWKERTITLPAEIVKNSRTHTFPFGEMAARILKALPKEGYLFPATRGGGAFDSWAKSKYLFDEKCPIEPWTIHDLRRTFATLHAAIGTPPHVTERLLNHASGTISGVAAIYNRHAYMDEMREATQKWEKHFKRIVAPVRLAA